jgi:hypothetical protein
MKILLFFMQDLRKLLGGNSVLLKYVYPHNEQWNEENFLALSCLKAILINMESSESSVSSEFLKLIKTIALQTLSKMSYEDLDKLYFNKVFNQYLQSYLKNL